jgi:hypothetical protein
MFVNLKKIKKILVFVQVLVPCVNRPQFQIPFFDKNYGFDSG